MTPLFCFGDPAYVDRRLRMRGFRDRNPQYCQYKTQKLNRALASDGTRVYFGGNMSGHSPGSQIRYVPNIAIHSDYGSTAKKELKQETFLTRRKTPEEGEGDDSVEVLATQA